MAACRATPPAAPAPRAPSFIIVTMDSFRADRIAAYGGAPHVTPFLSALAENATVFEHPLTAIPGTIPSHSSLFTGLYPPTHGVQRNGGTLSAGFTTLAEHLSAEGYETAAFAQLGTLLGRAGLGQGFQHSSAATDAKFRSSANVSALAREWMDKRDPSRPFLLWMHLFEVHPGFLPTPYSRPVVEGAGGHLACGAPMGLFVEYGTPVLPAGPAIREAIGILYDGEALVLDATVRDLYAEWARRGLLDEAVLIVTADHGVMLGEHGLTALIELYDEAVRIPFIVRLPGQKEGRRTRTKVSLVDVVPTILDWLSIEPERPLDGRSFLPALHGTDLPDVVRRCSTLIPAPGSPDSNLVAAYLDRYKLLLDQRGPRLFDIVADPGEVTPLPPPAVPEEIRSKLQAAAEDHRRRARPGSGASQ